MYVGGITLSPEGAPRRRQGSFQGGVPFEGLGEDELEVLGKVAQLLRRIDFGTVVLVVHDGRVVQVEMAEKFRLT